jgi:hypothetical protein
MAFKSKYLKDYNTRGAKNEQDKLKIKQWKDLPKKVKRKTKKKKA